MRELIVLNYSMDDSHPLLSHQVDIANLLALRFNHVTVITMDGSSFEIGNMEVRSVGWLPGRNVRNLWNLYRVAMPTLFKYRRNSVLFSHMTDLQSSLLAPIAKLFGIRHYLWYAHKIKSKYLQIASYFVDKVITSTKGSCPIDSAKVISIGQAIDQNSFTFNPRTPNAYLFKAIHIGRFDPSKNLERIFSSISELRKDFSELTITQIGLPSNKLAFDDANRLQEKWSNGVSEGWIVIKPSVKRSQLPEVISDYDVFFHSYFGSLDKTLIEATMCGLPVVTINPEYLKEFGSWSGKNDVTLENEYLNLIQMSPPDYSEEIQRRYRISLDRHSREKWIDSVVTILLSKQSNQGQER